MLSWVIPEQMSAAVVGGGAESATLGRWAKAVDGCAGVVSMS
jgi:hypothetical protein